MNSEPFHLSSAEAEAVDRNHTRLAAIGDKGRTADLFATFGGEDLSLTSEIIRAPAARPAPAPSLQGMLF